MGPSTTTPTFQRSEGDGLDFPGLTCARTQNSRSWPAVLSALLLCSSKVPLVKSGPENQLCPFLISSPCKFSHFSPSTAIWVFHLKNKNPSSMSLTFVRNSEPSLLYLVRLLAPLLSRSPSKTNYSVVLMLFLPEQELCNTQFPKSQLWQLPLKLQ